MYANRLTVHIDWFLIGEIKTGHSNRLSTSFRQTMYDIVWNKYLSMNYFIGRWLWPGFSLSLVQVQGMANIRTNKTELINWGWDHVTDFVLSWLGTYDMLLLRQILYIFLQCNTENHCSRQFLTELFTMSVAQDKELLLTVMLTCLRSEISTVILFTNNCWFWDIFTMYFIQINCSIITYQGFFPWNRVCRGRHLEKNSVVESRAQKYRTRAK
jgi:hypothetical protein